MLSRCCRSLPASARVAAGRMVAVLEAAGALTQMLLSWRSAPSGAAAAVQAHGPSRALPATEHVHGSAAPAACTGPLTCGCGTEGRSTSPCCWRALPLPSCPPRSGSLPVLPGLGEQLLPSRGKPECSLCSDTEVGPGVAGEVPE